MRKVTIQVPATITNLGPGLNSLALAIKIHNFVTLEEVEKPGYFITNLNEAASLPSDETNTIYLAVRDFLEKRLKYKPKHGIHIINDFKVPLNRGLNSLATAVVASLIAASVLAEIEITPEEVLNFLKLYEPEPQNLCATVLGGFVISCVADDRIVAHKIPFPEDLKLTLMIPNYDFVSLDAHHLLPEKVPMKDAIFNMSRVALFISSICLKNFKILNFAMEDRLHQPYRRRKIPAAEEIFLIARTCDTLGVTLCGNGSSLLIIHKHACEATIKKIKSAYARYNVPVQTFNTEVDEYGASLHTTK